MDTTSGMKASVLVVFPALNEAESLPLVLRRLREAGLHRVRVVDNGSTDGTAAVAREAGAEAIPELRRGYGQACWTGCRNLPGDVRWILFCNADGSDDLMAVEAMLHRRHPDAEVRPSRQTGAWRQSPRPLPRTTR